LIPMAKAFDIGVTAWSPLAGGLLTGKYNTSETASEANGLIHLNLEKLTNETSKLLTKLAK